MASSKRAIINSQPKTASKISDPEIEKLLHPKNRDQLRDALIKKLTELYSSPERKDNNDFINSSIADFLKHEKLTKVIFRKMEQRIIANSNKKTKPQSSINIQQEHHHHHDDAFSGADSDRPKSVYIQGDSENEWATILKYDTELYKREKVLEKAKEQELKQRTKLELDRQIAEKNRLKREEKDEMIKYTHFVQGQLKQQATVEKKKEEEMKNKIMHEKQSRDQQLLEENKRKREEKKVQKEMDDILLTKIRQQMDEEAKIAVSRRQEDKQQLKKLLIENEQHKKRMAEVARKEKEADIKAQQEYTRLLEKQMAEREAEFKAREDRAKKFMSMMADTVVKNQREQIIEEERILLKNHLDKERRDVEEDRRRQQRAFDQKQDVKNYLDQQVAEKKRKRQEEVDLEKKQVEIWKKETQNFKQQEKSKAEYIRDVNKNNADYLKKQIQDEKKKMKEISSTELLFNKPIFKEIAKNQKDSHFEKKMLRS